jgi:hypothetical protein
MKKLSILTSYVIYFATCVAIIALYLYSTVIKEDAEMFNQSRPLISQYYNLNTVAFMGVGLNLSYYFYAKSRNKTLSVIHLILAIALAIFGAYGIIAVMISR